MKRSDPIQQCENIPQQMEICHFSHKEFTRAGVHISVYGSMFLVFKLLCIRIDILDAYASFKKSFLWVSIHFSSRWCKTTFCMHYRAERRGWVLSREGVENFQTRNTRFAQFKRLLRVKWDDTTAEMLHQLGWEDDGRGRTCSRSEKALQSQLFSFFSLNGKNRNTLSG